MEFLLNSKGSKMEKVVIRLEAGILKVLELPDNTELTIEDPEYNEKLVFTKWEDKIVRREEKLDGTR